MQEIQYIDNLLQSVAAINKKYEGLSKITGENFNIFRLLGLAYNEVKTHSMFITELLNPQGSHDQGSVFLEQFIKHKAINIEAFDTASAVAYAEFYIGPVTNTTGGRIDIFIKDKDNNYLIIENKIYAGEQENQLLRYYNYGKQGKSMKLFYLSLNGDEASEYSKGNQTITYQHISYKNTIIEWLESCKKEAVNLPILRENITQYIYLLKHLTNQTQNHAMQKEIIDLILQRKENLQSFFDLQQSNKAVYDQLIVHLHKELNDAIKKLELGLELDFDMAINNTAKYVGFSIKGDILSRYNLIMRFEFDKSYNEDLCYGFCYINTENAIKNDSVSNFLKNRFAQSFNKKVYSSPSWPVYVYWDEYLTWDDHVYMMIYNNEMTEPIIEKIKAMLDIIESIDKESNK